TRTRVSAVPAPRRQSERRRGRARARGRQGFHRGDGRRSVGRGHARWRPHRDRQPARGERVTKLLVIDDDARFLRALAISLRARGYEIETATTGEEGLAVAARAHPDVVVLDLGLPDLSGLDVLRALRGWTTVPVIVLSARHEEQTKVEALDIGAD